MFASTQFFALVLPKLAWRNLWRHRRRTLITLFSIVIGFTLIVFSTGLADGSHNSMIRNAIGLGEGHLSIQNPLQLSAPANHHYLKDAGQWIEQLHTLDMPALIQSRISLSMLASTANNSVGVVLEGADLKEDLRRKLFDNPLQQGQWSSADARGLIIGHKLARKLKVDLNSKIVLMAGTSGGDSQAHLGRVRGIFNSGLDDIDSRVIFCNLDFARRFLAGEGADITLLPLTRIAIFLDNPDSASYWQERIAATAGDSEARVFYWQEMMPQLVQFIWLDNMGNYVFFSFILLLLLAGIINTVLMSVLERTREFGLLRALGLNRWHLLALVCCETLLMSLLALLSGWILAGGIHLWFAQYGFDLSAMIGGSTAIAGTYIDPIIYSELSWWRIAQLSGVIFVVTMISGIYPAINAARTTPVEALRT